MAYYGRFSDQCEPQLNESRKGGHGRYLSPMVQKIPSIFHRQICRTFDRASFFKSPPIGHNGFRNSTGKGSAQLSRPWYQSMSIYTKTRCVTLSGNVRLTRKCKDKLHLGEILGSHRRRHTVGGNEVSQESCDGLSRTRMVKDATSCI